MADFPVIADVSTTLQSLLDTALNPLGVNARLHDLGTPVPTSPPVLTIFLYEAGEDTASRNRPDTRRMIGPNAVQITRAPMALMLKYLITPWSGDAATDHRILGRAMQVLYDNAVLEGTQLQGTLANTNETLKITITPLSMDERTKVWYAVQRTYRLSSAYEVRVVNLDSQRQDVRPPVREYHRHSGTRIDGVNP
jgi:Pvc16 N-terminal domain